MISTYPLLSKLKYPSSLSDSFRTILLAAAHVASGDAASTTAAFSHLPTNLLPKAYELCLLQSAPLIGVPRVLHSAAALQIANLTIPPSDPALSSTSTRDQGEEIFRTVYARHSDRVLNRLQNFHPALEDWIISSVYGQILGRKMEDVSMRERELCIVAVLAVDPVASVQLASHLRGALNVGATREEIEAVIQQTRVVKPDAAESAEAVWYGFERARYAL